MTSSGEFRITKPGGRTTRRRRKKFFRGLFRSTKWRVGSDGCAIFLFVKKTRHSIRCPFSYLLRKMTTSECSSFSYTQNPPVCGYKDRVNLFVFIPNQYKVLWSLCL